MAFRGRLVLSAEIADGAVGRDQLATGAVGSDELADLAVIASKLADGSLDRGDLFAGPIVAPEHIDHLDADLITAGTMAVEHLAAGTMVAGRHLRSANYIAGASGWQLDADGNLEANDVTARGVLQTGPDGTDRVAIDEDDAADTSGLYWYDTADARVASLVVRTGGSLPGFFLDSPQVPVTIQSDPIKLIGNETVILDGSWGFDPSDGIGLAQNAAEQRRLDVDAAVRPAPGIGEGAESTPPDDYPAGLTASPTVAAAQGWPLQTGARGAVLTVKAGSGAFQLVSDSGANALKFRSRDHNNNAWHAWKTVT